MLPLWHAQQPTSSFLVAHLDALNVVVCEYCFPVYSTYSTTAFRAERQHSNREETTSFSEREVLRQAAVNKLTLAEHMVNLQTTKMVIETCTAFVAGQSDMTPDAAGGLG